METLDPFALENLVLPEEVKTNNVVKFRAAKQANQFLMIPVPWLEKLRGATGGTYALALVLLHRDFKAHGRPFKLANGLLELEGIGRHAKWRGLADLEARSLITITRRPRQSPLITVKSCRNGAA